MSPHLLFNQLDDSGIIRMIRQTFPNAVWTEVFLNDSHHGFDHGKQVRQSSLQLLEQLTDEETKQLNHETLALSAQHPEEHAQTAITIAAIFHDCGRFNDDGLCLAPEQREHHIRSEKRAAQFCRANRFENIIPVVSEAILSHDFQSTRLTPHMTPPSSIIGKIVQSADQIYWFHPDSPHRTLKYGQTIGVPFFKPEFTIEQRLTWVPGGIEQDSISVMLTQLFGPTGHDRFGIEAARRQIESYRPALKQTILSMAVTEEQREQIRELIEQYGAARDAKANQQTHTDRPIA